MRRRAVSWVETVLGSHVSGVVELPGGLSSTVLAVTDVSGRHSVLRLMTNEPWRSFGEELTLREQAAQQELAGSVIPAPLSFAVDPTGLAAGVAAHLMSRLPGVPTLTVGDQTLREMARMLAKIHDVTPTKPFRAYQSWAPPEKWTVPPWTQNPDAWQHAFAVLSQTPPSYEPLFLHRDYSHRNLLWTQETISGVVDWVETSTGPAALDVAHAATNLALSYDLETAVKFIAAYTAVTVRPVDPYWLIMDTVGFLPAPGKPPLFNTTKELDGLDQWLTHVITAT